MSRGQRQAVLSDAVRAMRGLPAQFAGRQLSGHCVQLLMRSNMAWRSMLPFSEVSSMSPGQAAGRSTLKSSVALIVRLFCLL